MPAHAELCNASERFCGFGPGNASESTGAPTRGSKVRINPSSVPTGKSLGLEFIYFDQSVDFALVKGLGRVGAAISPSNSEETFFGPPGIELPEDLLKRNQDKHKFPAQKVTLASAIGLFNNKHSDLTRFELNVGFMGKYNRLTHAITPGGGLSGVAGPFTFGYSLYRDQTQLDYGLYGLSQKPVTNYYVETYSVGAFLNSLAIDYSVLRMITNEIATTSVVTATLLLNRSLVTVAVRRESSNRPAYNYDLARLETKIDKSDIFAGAQYAIFDHLMAGIFYNYYVLREYSVGATLFF